MLFFYRIDIKSYRFSIVSYFTLIVIIFLALPIDAIILALPFFFVIIIHEHSNVDALGIRGESNFTNLESAYHQNSTNPEFTDTYYSTNSKSKGCNPDKYGISMTPKLNEFEIHGIILFNKFEIRE